QNRFHRAATVSNNCLELRKTNLKRVRTDVARLQKLIHIFDQLDLAKFALIVEGQLAVSGETKNYPCSFGRYFTVIEVLNRAGHAEMQSQPERIADVYKQMFAVPVTIFEAMPFQSTCQLTRGNTFQNIRVAHLDIGDALMQR